MFAYFGFGTNIMIFIDQKWAYIVHMPEEIALALESNLNI